MNKLRTIAIIFALLAVSLTSLAQQRLFKNFAGDKSISTVYISPAAMKMGLSLDYGEKEMEAIGKAIKNPEGMEIVTAETAKSAEKLRTYTKQQIENYKMQSFINVAEGDEKVNIYICQLINENTMKDILIEVSENNEYTVIYIKGEVDVNALANLK